MKFNTDIQTGMLCLLIVGAGVATNINKNTAITKLMAGAGTELVQTKYTNAGTVRMQVIPQTGFNADSIKKACYTIRITLKSNEPAKQSPLMQYMSFDIRNRFCAVQGRDTLPCVVCERIPGISANEFLYITRFNKPLKNTDDNLRICITNTAAGFGTTVFEIKKQAVTKLEAIK